MPVAGKIYVVPLPNENAWQLVVHNTGDKPFGLTQNILPSHNPDLKAHDDHAQYGHGLPVHTGAVSWQKFAAGEIYDHGDHGGKHPIDDNCYLRVGLRNLAFKTVKLPRMDELPLELDVADFNWYSGNVDNAQPQIDERYPGTKPRVPNAADGPALLARIQELIARGMTNGIKCEGAATVKAVRSEDGALSHWELRFDNSADQAFIGTCSFVGAQKNDGIGLEAMGLPKRGSAAVQRIEAYGNYGVEAAPGAKVRIGVRGYGWIEVALPRDGAVELPLDTFKIDSRQMSPDFFDTAMVTAKRDEKVAKVQFFDGDTAINAALKPTLWKGADARQRSTFSAPHMTLTAVDNGPNTPGGGYLVTLTSALPDFVDDARAGFIAAIRLAGADPDAPAARIGAPKKFEHEGQCKSWFLPNGADCGGVTVKAGATLQLATKGLGWQASVTLPTTGTIDTARDDDVWGLREDQESSRMLRQSYVQRLRD